MERYIKLTDCMVVKVSPSTPAGEKGFKMTDYIEEMMETADILGDSICSNCDRNAPDDTLGLYCNGCMSIDKNIYSDFTAEKQLELIKLMVPLGFFKTTNNAPLDLYAISGGGEPEFKESLAAMITGLMKAGELDKEKVKEILEG